MRGTQSRRDFLKRVGTAGTLSVLGGCMSGDPPADDPDSGADTTRAVTAAGDTPSETATRTPHSGPDGYEPRFYAGYVPQRDFELPRRVPGTVSGDIRTAWRHRRDFGGKHNDYRQQWSGWIPTVTPQESRFLIKHRLGGAVLGNFSKDTAVTQLTMDNDHIESRGEKKGYALYFDDYLDLLLAVADTEILSVFSDGGELGAKRMDHLLGIVAGDEQSYYRTDPDYQAVIEYLPQGIYTQVFDGGQLRQPLLSLVAAGQTIFFDGDAPIVRTVLRYPTTVSDPVGTTKSYLRDDPNDSYEADIRLWNHSFNNPQVRAPTDRTVIVRDRANLEKTF